MTFTCCGIKGTACFAGIFTLFQSSMGIILCVYNLAVFTGGPSQDSTAKVFLWTTQTDNFIVMLLAVETALYFLWIFSAVLMLSGNKTGEPNQILPWIIFSIIMTICDIALPAVLLKQTLHLVLEKYTDDQEYLDDHLHTSTPSPNSVSPGLLSNYILLVITFSRGWVLFWIPNIVLNVITCRRFYDLKKTSGARGIHDEDTRVPEKRLEYSDPVPSYNDLFPNRVPEVGLARTN